MDCSTPPGKIASRRVGAASASAPTTPDQAGVGRISQPPAGLYCGNASYLILWAKIEIAFSAAVGVSSPNTEKENAARDALDAAHKVNVTAKVDGLNLVHCPGETYTYDAASGNVTLTNLRNKTDCVNKFVTIMGGNVSGVTLVYNATLDTLSAGFEGEYCVFTKDACKK